VVHLVTVDSSDWQSTDEGAERGRAGRQLI